MNIGKFFFRLFLILFINLKILLKSTENIALYFSKFETKRLLARYYGSKAQKIIKYFLNYLDTLYQIITIIVKNISN